MRLRKSIMRCLTAGAVVVLSTPLTMAAALNVMTDQAAWEALVSNVSTIDFDTASQGYTPLAPDTYVPLTVDTLTINGVTFTSYLNTGIQKFILSNYNSWNSGTVLKTQTYTLNSDNRIHIDLPTGGVTAWGVDLVAGGSYGTYTITIGTDSYTTGTSPTSSRNFYGVTSTTPFTAVDITYVNGTSNNAVLDNLRTASVKAPDVQPPPPPPTGAETPEAGTLILCATGLLSLSKFVRRKIC